MDNILSLDFETANSKRVACSIGVVHSIGGETVLEKHFLINPESDFEKNSIWVHGINENTVRNAPTLPKVLEEAFGHVSKDTVFLAHNAKFDFDVLKRGVERYRLNLPSIKFLCSVKLSESYFTGLPGYNLALLSEELGFALDHHNALSDARGALSIFNSIDDSLKQSGKSFNSFLRENDFRFGRLVGSELSHVKRGKSVACYSLPVPKGKDRFLFRGKSFCFVGDFSYWKRKQLEQLVTDRGGLVEPRMSSLVDYYVIGHRGYFVSPEDWEFRVNKALDFSKSSKMRVLTEKDFVKGMKSLLT